MMEPTWIFLFTRVLLALPFFYSGVFSLLHFKDTVRFMETKNLPYPTMGLCGAIFLKLFGSVALVFGIYISLAALTLALFTLLCTIIFHDFWNLKGKERTHEIFMVTTIAGLVGGLFLLAILP